MNARTYRTPLFLIPSLAGAETMPPAMSRQLAPICHWFDHLRFPGVDGQEPPSTSTEEIAAHLIDQVREMFPHGPYALCGYSFGGLVAYEMACQLRQRGCEVETLLLWDASTWESNEFSRRPLSESISVLRDRFSTLSSPQIADFIREKLVDNWRFRGIELIQGLKSTASDLCPPLGRMIQRSFPKSKQQIVIEASLKAFLAYGRKQYEGDVVLFRALECPGIFHRSVFKAALGWDEFVIGRLEVVDIPGYHLAIWKEPMVNILARETANWLLANRCSKPSTPCLVDLQNNKTSPLGIPSSL